MIPILDLYGSNVDLPLLYGTHIWVLRGTNCIISKNNKFPDINANNNDYNKIKIIHVVCSLQHESIYY